MTIGKELDQAFYNLGQRITRLEKKEVEYPIVNDFVDKEMVLGIESGLTSQIERLECELNDRVDRLEDDMGFDPDDLRCDLESQIEEVSDNWSYLDDRVDDIDCMKITEDEARNIAIDVVREEISEVISDYVEEAVCHEINTRAVGFTEYLNMCDRVKELEDRLNKPTLGARVLRWLREGPSAKELATKWYASLRRARV
tara:strand:- start:160 stop:756 length:597 start_codon:yes stop_codon:yes gene_type:complete